MLRSNKVFTTRIVVRMKSTWFGAETIRRSPILGFPIAVTETREAVAQVLRWAAQPDQAALRLPAANTHVITLTELEHARSFAEAWENFNLGFATECLCWYLNHFRKAGLKMGLRTGFNAACFAAARNGVGYYSVRCWQGIEEKMEREQIRRFRRVGTRRWLLASIR